MISKVDCLTSNTDTIYLFCTIIYILILFIFFIQLGLILQLHHGRKKLEKSNTSLGSSAF